MESLAALLEPTERQNVVEGQETPSNVAAHPGFGCSNVVTVSTSAEAGVLDTASNPMITEAARSKVDRNERCDEARATEDMMVLSKRMPSPSHRVARGESGITKD